MMDFRKIIQAYGAEALAEDLGRKVKPPAVGMMKKRNRISPEYWKTLIEKSKRRHLVDPESGETFLLTTDLLAEAEIHYQTAKHQPELNLTGAGQ